MMKECNCQTASSASCSHIGCTMKFQPHNLTGYKKGNDIKININTKQIGCADQTPTPTRFLRNCEEVGLFQDLQVNPFEETFRKAVEAGIPREGKESLFNITDDTLHTPKVFPIVNEFQHCKEINDDRKSSQLTTAAIRSKRKCGQAKKKNVPSVEQSTQCESHFVVVDKNVTFKLPIPKLPPGVKVVSQKNFAVFSKNSLKILPTDQPSNFMKQSKEDEKFSLLESNRLAQKRSRDKRKLFYKQLLQRNGELEETVKILMKENDLLRKKLEHKHFINVKKSKNLSVQHINSNITENDPSECEIEQTPNKTILVNSEILCLESCLPNLDAKDSVETPASEISQVVLRKPFKKRDIHPKLYLSCKPAANK